MYNRNDKTFYLSVIILELLFHTAAAVAAAAAAVAASANPHSNANRFSLKYSTYPTNLNGTRTDFKHFH